MAKAPVLTPRADDFPRWYQDLINKAELADNDPVRGTMVIRPYGYGLWERMQAVILAIKGDEAVLAKVRELGDRLKAAGIRRPCRRRTRRCC